MTTHIFSAEEWLAWLTDGGHLPEGCPLTPDRLTPEMLIVAVFAEDRLVAVWPLWNATHLDGLWVEAASRGNPGVLRPLLEAVSATLAANQVHTSFAVVAEEDTAGADQLTRLGFVRVPGILFRRETPA